MISERLFELLVAQTWQVAVLAAAVWGIVRICGGDRPHLAHCLWALVLLKCLMPPVWTSPVGLFCWINTKANQLPSMQWFAQSTVAPQLPAAELAASSDVTIRIFDARASRENLPFDASSPRSITQRKTTAIERGEQCLLVVWLIGCGVSFSVAIARLVHFGRFVRRSSLQRKQKVCNANMEYLVQRLSERLHFGRRVRISILDAAVGPAVYGLIRPTILLPAAIALNRPLRELEPLVAHELVHIRRGDLWWALVQTLACCLFWFHPLVWLAQAMLVREAERSCDEETIASLGVSPSTYARSLLDVLECKQRLHGAPALPGVRSVDVTRSRLERIMRLGHGSHASTPVWVWLLFFCCVAVLLPGGAWLSAQEEKSEGSPHKISAEKPNSTTEQLAPPAIGAWAESWQNESIDVGDLLDKLEAQHGDREVAPRMLLSMIAQRSINTINAEGHATMSTVSPFSIDGDDLHVFETREQIAIVKNGLEELRRYGFDSIQLRLKLLAIPAEQLDALGLIWEKALEPTSQVTVRLDSMRPTQEMKTGSLPAAPAALNPVQPASAVGEAAQPVPVTIVEAISGRITLGEFEAKVRKEIESHQSLDEQDHSDLGTAGWLTVSDSSNAVTTHCAVIEAEKVTAISKLTESGEKQSVLSAPQITCSNGGCVQVVSYSPWSIKPQIASFDKPSPIQPLPQLGFSGFSLAAHPLIETKTDNSEKTNIDLSLVCETREVTRLDKFIFEGRQTNVVDGEKTTTIVEQPNVELKKLAVRHKLQAGESLLISSRELLAPQSENKILVIVATCEVIPAGMIQTERGQTLKSNVLRPEPTTDPLP